MPQESYEWYKTSVIELKSNITRGSYSSMYVHEIQFLVLYIVKTTLQFKTFFLLSNIFNNCVQNDDKRK